MSVMNGCRVELFDKIVGLNGHAVVQGYNGQLRDWRTIAAEARALLGVNSAVPLIEQPLMANYNGRVEGVLVRGMHANDIRTNATDRKSTRLKLQSIISSSYAVFCLKNTKTKK